MKLKALVFTLALPASFVVLAACGASNTVTSPAPSVTGSTGSATPHTGGIISAGIDSDPGNFDTLADQSLGQSTVNAQIYDPLTTINGSGDVEPGLAKSWTQSPTTLVLSLRQGVTFTDGTPFNAAAVVFDMNRILGKTSSYASLFGSVQSVTATNADTVTFTLRQSDSSLLQALATRAAYMPSPTAVGKWGKTYGLHPVGTGPFMLSSYTPNNEVVLTRNQHYWMAGSPHLDGVNFKIIADESSKVAALLSGQIQTEDYIEPVDISRVKGQTQFQHYPGVLVPYLPLNLNQPPLNDPNVREAISLALDRASLCKNVLFGYATPANSLLSPAYPQYDHSLPAPTADTAKAMQLLNGRKISLTIQVPPTYTGLAQVVQQQLQAVGITVKLQDMDWGTLVNNFFKQNFQAQIEDFTGQWPDPQVTLGGFYSTGGADNGLAYQNADLASALSSAAAASTISEAMPFYQKAQQLAAAANVYLPIAWIDNLRASSESVHGLPTLPTGTLDFRDAWLS